MKQWMGVWFQTNSFIKSAHNQWIIIMIAYFKGYNSPII